MLTDDEAAKLAEPIVKEVVDLIAEGRYSELEKVVRMPYFPPAYFENAVSVTLMDDELTHVDKFGVPCSYSYKHHQLTAGVFKDGVILVNYHMTTDSEPNNIMLVMEFFLNEKGELIAELCDVKT